jgi:hypothetical protein
MKKPLTVSFSGGRTSAYMTHWLLEQGHDLKCVFMNTGCEHPATLEFVRRCTDEWNLDLTWIEAVVHHDERKACTHRVVNYKTASRNGEPFEEMVKKYGLPNQAYPHCTRELKLNPFKSFIAENDLSDRPIAIGIRADEFDRVSPAKHIIYPLIKDHPTTQDDVNLWWQKHPFDLGIAQYIGNCTWCWKKTYTKLVRIAHDIPKVFDFPIHLEDTYGLNGHNVDGTPRTMFRGNLTGRDVLKLDIQEYRESRMQQPDMFWDASGGCSESCEVFAE